MQESLRSKVAAVGAMYSGKPSAELGDYFIDLLETYGQSIIPSEPQSRESDTERYYKVFNDVTEDDVESLSTYLEQRATVNKQTAESKQASLNKLQDDLIKKFQSRIR